MADVAGASGGLWLWLLWAGGGILALGLLALARRQVLMLLDAIFEDGADLFERFAAGARDLSGNLAVQARSALVQMQRAEFAHEMASRQKELMTLLDRFARIDGKYADVIEALKRDEDARGYGADARTLMRLSAELAAADDRFSRNVEYLRANEDVVRAVHDEQVYTFSPFIRFAFAALFIPLILMGGVLNFFLIQRPLESLFTETGFAVAGVATLAEASAATIVVIEAVVGFFFLEALRITRVLPNFHELAPRVRAVWAAVFFTILAAFAGIEAALALWREELIALEAAVETGGPVSLGAAPVFFQVTLGILMPFVLALVAIPLETFLKNARVVGLFSAAGVMALVGLPFTVAGAVIRFVGRVLAAAFLAMTFAPQDAPGVLARRRSGTHPDPREEETP